MANDLVPDAVAPTKPANLAEAKLRGTGVPIARSGGSFLPNFSDGGQMMEFAAMMAGAGVMVGPAVRNNPGACMGVVMMASRFGLDPFLLSHKAYVTKNKAGVEVQAWEAQAIYAMILGSGALAEPFEFEYSGSGDTRRVRVIGRLAGTSKDRDVTTNEVGRIAIKNSPLWNSEPDQQLAYYGSRLWARRHAPHILMGVYDREEADLIARTDENGFVNITPERADPVTRLQANLKAGRPPVEEPEPEPDPPAGAAALPADELEEDEPEQAAAEIAPEEESKQEEAAADDPLPPPPGELVRTKKGALEYAQRWAAYWKAIPKDQEDEFLAETEALTDLAKNLNPAAVDVIDDAFNAPKMLV